jgi:hypothetical protein
MVSGGQETNLQIATFLSTSRGGTSAALKVTRKRRFFFISRAADRPVGRMLCSTLQSQRECDMRMDAKDAENFTRSERV